MIDMNVDQFLPLCQGYLGVSFYADALAIVDISNYKRIATLSSGLHFPLKFLKEDHRIEKIIVDHASFSLWSFQVYFSTPEHELLFKMTHL